MINGLAFVNIDLKVDLFSSILFSKTINLLVETHINISSKTRQQFTILGYFEYNIDIKLAVLTRSLWIGCIHRLYSNPLHYEFLLQMYDHVASAELTLINSGKVGFEFCALGMDPANAKKPRPGLPVMVPHSVSTL
jgi:hypothetical protein